MANPILIVARHASLRESLCDWLSLQLPGCRVIAAEDEAAALDHIQRIPVQAAVVDIDCLPPQGLDLVPRILASTPDMPVIAIGLDESQTQRDAAMGAGALVYVPKSMLPAELLEILQAVLSATKGGERENNRGVVWNAQERRFVIHEDKQIV